MTITTKETIKGLESIKENLGNILVCGVAGAAQIHKYEILNQAKDYLDKLIEFYSNSKKDEYEYPDNIIEAIENGTTIPTDVPKYVTDQNCATLTFNAEEYQKFLQATTEQAKQLEEANKKLAEMQAFIEKQQQVAAANQQLFQFVNPQAGAPVQF